jgi:2-polyprenyl-6-methoxyphenol hydroxylase-like FAD-dependent oxidoreductase
MAELRTHLATERVRVVTLRLKHTRPSSIPTHPEQESRQRKIAERVLPPAFKDLLRATKEPFVQAIMDLACPQLVFNRTILMGDASFVIRPHTAASTSKGIANAFALVGELAGKQELSESLDHWQQSELNRGQRLMSYGQGLGRSQGR